MTGYKNTMLLRCFSTLCLNSYKKLSENCIFLYIILDKKFRQIKIFFYEEFEIKGFEKNTYIFPF